MPFSTSGNNLDNTLGLRSSGNSVLFSQSNCGITDTEMKFIKDDDETKQKYLEIIDEDLQDTDRQIDNKFQFDSDLSGQFKTDIEN